MTGVVMVGSCLDSKGGIASVERMILDHMPENIVREHIATYSNRSFLGSIRFVPSAVARLLTRFPRGFLAHVHFSYRGSFFREVSLGLLCKFWGAKLLLHAHGSEFVQFYRKGPEWRRCFIQKALGKTDGLIVLSESWRAFYCDEVGVDRRRVFVLPNAVEIPVALSPKSGTGRAEVLFLGRLGTRKGVWDILDALEIIRDSCKIDKTKLHVTLAGDGDVERVRSEVERRRIGEYVSVPGWVEHHEKDELLGASNVFLLPSYNEGLPMGLLEAMGWGLAPISSPVGGIPEVIEHGVNGVLIRPGDVAALARELEWVALDGLRRAEVGSKARESVLPYGAEAYVDKLRSVYVELLEQIGVS